MDTCQAVISIFDSSPNVYINIGDASQPSAAGDYVVRDLIGVIDGSNSTFTAPESFVIASVGVYINGILQKKVYGWNNTGNQTIIFTSSPMVGDLLQISYIKL